MFQKRKKEVKKYINCQHRAPQAATLNTKIMEQNIEADHKIQKIFWWHQERSLKESKQCKQGLTFISHSFLFSNCWLSPHSSPKKKKRQDIVDYCFNCEILSRWFLPKMAICKLQTILALVHVTRLRVPPWTLCRLCLISVLLLRRFSRVQLCATP